MRLVFKQKLLSVLDSYNIYDDYDNIVYTVKSKLAIGHYMKIYNAAGKEVGTIKQKVITLLPKFEIYRGANYMGCISRELTLLKPKYNIDCNGWQIKGDFMEWDYTIADSFGRIIASMNKEIFHMTDHYVINVNNDNDALMAVMVVLAIDAEKCSRD